MVARRQQPLTKHQAMQWYAIGLTLTCASAVFWHGRGLAFVLLATPMTSITKSFGSKGTLLALLGVGAAIARTVALHDLAART